MRFEDTAELECIVYPYTPYIQLVLQHGQINYSQHACLPRQYVVSSPPAPFPPSAHHRNFQLDFFPENCTKDNFPLVFSEVELVERPAPINPDFIKRFLPKLDWKALVDTARSVRYGAPGQASVY